MKPLYALLFMMFSSCTAYQMFTVSSSNVRQNDDNGLFIVDNDSLTLKYNFDGQGGPINISVFNKLDQPIILDWTRSSIIINDEAISYLPKDAQITASSAGFSTNGGGMKQSWSNFVGSITLPQYMQFIPPKSYITKQPVMLINGMLENIPDSSFRRISVPLHNEDAVYAKMVQFTEDKSPLRFKSYLTFYTTDSNDRKNQFVCQDNFYVSRLYKLNADPSTTEIMKTNTAGIFYVSKTTAFGKIMYGVAVVGAFTGAAALESSNNSTTTVQ